MSMRYPSLRALCLAVLAAFTFACGSPDESSSEGVGSVSEALAQEREVTLTRVGNNSGWNRLDAITDGSIKKTASKSTKTLERIEYQLDGSYELNRARLNTEEVEAWNLQYWDGSQWLDAFPLRQIGRDGWDGWDCGDRWHGGKWRDSFPRRRGNDRDGWHEVDFPNVSTNKVRLQLDPRHHELSVRELDVFGVLLCKTANDCNDGVACTTDSCGLRGCKNDSSACECLKDADCNDSDACTGDKCTANKCVHTMECQPPSCNFPGNLIQNCDFSAGLTGYATDIYFNGAAGTQQVVGGELNVGITSGADANWAVQPRQGALTLEPNVKYSVRFRARASAPRPITVSMTQDGGAFTSYSGDQVFNLTATMQQFQFEFTMGNQRETNAKFEVRAGYYGVGATWSALPSVIMDDWVLEAIGGGCTADSQCDDGIACTVDSCSARACKHDATACECMTDANCNDGDACTFDFCELNHCLHNQECQPASCNFPGNMIQNCDFSAGLTGYATDMFFNGAAGTQQVVNGQLSVDITSGADAVWAVQPRQGGLTLLPNVHYSVRFRARAGAPRPITVSLTQDGGAFTSYSGDRVFNLTTTMQEYAFDFTMGNLTETNAKLEVKAGYYGVGATWSPLPSVVMDDWVLEAIGGECSANAECDDGIACTVDTCTGFSCKHDSAGCASSCNVPGNLIHNCDFSAGVTGYATDLFFNGAAGTQQVVGGELNVDITSGADANWAVQPRQGGLTLEPNVQYRARFRARASAPRPLAVSLTQDGGAFTSYSGEQVFNLTTAMQDYQFEFTMGAARETNAKFEVRAGYYGVGATWSPLPSVIMDDWMLEAIGGGCSSNSECDDGIACTADTCSFRVCGHNDAGCQASACQTPENQIANCGFDAGLAGYATDIYFAGAFGNQSVNAGELQVTVDNCGSAPWNVQPRKEGLTLEANLPYEVRFKARASAPRKLLVSMTQNGGAFTSYSGYRTFDLTTEMKQYSFRFTMGPQRDPSAKLEIQAGYNGEIPAGAPMPTVVMDDLYLAPVQINPNRPHNANCVAGDAPTQAVAVQRLWPGVALTEPLDTVQVPAGAGTSYLIVEKGGRVLRVSGNTADSASQQLFHVNELSPPDQPLSVSGESGMTALVFHPDFGLAGAVGEHTLFVAYTRQATPKPGETYGSELVVASFQAIDTALSGIDLTSKVELLHIHQDSDIHHSGGMGLGPDGMLYLSIGDSGNNLQGDDNPAKAHDLSQPNGKIARLSPDQYDGNVTLGWSDLEVVAIGLRNPWRFSFDDATLWIGNVGFDKIEEVNALDLSNDIGVDFGWPWCEGDVCCTEGIDCSNLGPMPGNLRFAEYQYRRSQGPSGESAVIGGFVYRGTAMPNLQGKYIFGDFADQVIYSLDPASQQAEPILNNIGNVDDFGVDQNGEIYFTTLNGGVFRIIPGPGGTSHAPPQDLMAWGCFDSLNNGAPVPASGVIPYDIAQPFWSDGAHKERFFAIPDGTFLDVSDSNDWELPVGGVSIKNFYWQNNIFETRLFVRHNNGNYAGYTYQWTSPSTATLVPAAGASRDLGGIVWNYPSQAQCMTCHTAAAKRSLGLETRQLDLGNQIDEWANLTLLNTGVPEHLPAFPSVTDTGVDLETRAQAYLHVNCTSCHRGPVDSDAGRAKWDARFTTPFAQKALCNAVPVEPGLGTVNERLIVPGNHADSTVWLRIHQRDNSFMPPLATTRVDVDGTHLVEDFIDSLTACPAP
jgi:hypothetical protein